MLDIEFFAFLNVTGTSSAISWSIHRGKCHEVRSANQGRVKEKNKDITWRIWMKLYFSLSLTNIDDGSSHAANPWSAIAYGK